MHVNRASIAIAIAGGALSVAPAALAATPRAVYGGGASDGEPIVLTATPDGAKLAAAVVAWSARCGDDHILALSSQLAVAGRGAADTPRPRVLAMQRNAKARFAGVQRFGLQTDNGGIAVTVKLAGKLSRTAASGTLGVAANVADSAGNPVTTCSANLRWKAQRGPRVYGGSTTQEEPVVLRVNAARTKVDELRIGWRSRSCQPPGFITFGEDFGNFPLAGGRFGDGFDQTFDRDGGGKYTFTYTVGGRVARTTANGSFRAVFKETDATAAQVATCDSGPISWQARSG